MKSILLFLIRLYPWHVLKVIGASYLSTFTIVVPLFGYLIFFGQINDWVYSIDISKIGSVDLQISGAPSFIKLKLTYVGLSIIGLTTIVFRIFCPKEIVSNRDQKEYVESSVVTTFPSALERLQTEVVVSRWYDFALPEKTDLSDISVISTSDSLATRGRASAGYQLGRSDWLDRNLNAINAIYSVNYDSENISRFFLRTMICLAYAIGFVLTLIPSLEVFFPLLSEVISYLRMELPSQIWGNNSP